MNLYVGNLDYSIKEIELKQLFSQFGEVKYVKLMINTKTKKSKGFAFVEIDNFDYNQTVSILSKKEYRGRTLKINQGNI